jgi:hypothetical protein
VKILLMVATATLCFALTEPRVSTASIVAVEHSINDRFAAESSEPYYSLQDAHGTYLEGYGALFTSEINLVNSAAFTPNPFRPAVTPQQIAQVHDRKVKKLAELKDTMRSILMNASTTLEGMPAGERVALEVKLFSFSWENNRGIPHRVLMSAEKQKLLAAKENHSDLTAIVDEQER